MSQIIEEAAKQAACEGAHPKCATRAVRQVERDVEAGHNRERNHRLSGAGESNGSPDCRANREGQIGGEQPVEDLHRF